MEFQKIEHRPDRVTVKMGNHNIDFTDSDEVAIVNLRGFLNYFYRTPLP